MVAKTKSKAKAKPKAKGKPAPKVPDGYLNKRQMCDSMGISQTAFDKYKIEPILRQGGRAYYTVRQILNNRLENLAQQFEDRFQGSEEDGDELPPGSINGDREKARLDKERADGQALKNAVTRGELIPTDAAMYIFGEMGAEISSILEVIPAKLKRRVPILKAADINAVKKEIVKAQNIAADVAAGLDEYTEGYNAETANELAEGD